MVVLHDASDEDVAAPLVTLDVTVIAVSADALKSPAISSRMVRMCYPSASLGCCMTNVSVTLGPVVF
jgi:hypothetical protein